MSFRSVALCDGLEGGGTDSDALVVGQGDESADTATVLPSDEWKGGAEGDGFIFPECDEASRGPVKEPVR